MLLQNKKIDKLKEIDPMLYESLQEAVTLIDSGYPTLADHRIPWNNKASGVIEKLTQFKMNYQYLIDEISVRVKRLEYQEYMNSIENDQFKSWNEKSLMFYGNNEIVDFYRQQNHNRYVIGMITEFINTIKFMSR